jgi:hypothetical protein
MSTVNPAAYGNQPVATPQVVQDATVPDEQIRVFGHTNLLYWWPVWLVGFIMAALTYMDGHVMAVVPEGTTVESGKMIAGEGGPRDVLVAPPGQAMPPQPKAADGDTTPRLRVAASNNFGVIFVGTLLLVVLVTNITVRGLASVIVIAMIIIAGLLFAQFRLWDDIFYWLGGLDVRLNAGGYLAIAVPLFLIWAFSVFIYDRYTYLIVTRGQVRIRQEIGDGEVAVDTHALSLEKRRNDFFRHWLLGLGSGDLHVKTGGAANLDFDLYNVLFIGTKINRIQDLLREREMAQQAPGG